MTNGRPDTVRNSAVPPTVERMDTMTKRTATATATRPNRRDERIAKRAARTATATATATAPDTTPAVVPDATPATTPTDAAPSNVVRVLSFADFGIDTPANVPAHIPAMVSAFRAIAPMPVKTPTERIAARDAFIVAMRAAGVAGADTAAKHTGRFSSMPVFVAQNDMYVAMAMANVVVESGHVMAAWAAEFPGSTCGRNVDGCHGVPYIGRDYAWSTLSEYIHNRHNRTSIDNGSIIVAAWVARNRKPIA